MTIDEAIVNEREVLAKNKYQYECYMECSDNYKQNHKETIAQCKYDFEYHKQIAEWLEELKEYRKHIKLTEIPEQYKLGFQDGIANSFENEYNKAIDDFAEMLCHKIKSEIDDCADELDWIDEIAEQLKAGGENGKLSV